MFITRTRLLIAAVAAAALTVAGCSDDSTTATETTTSAAATTSASTRTDFNEADVTFLQMMYPHHAQAVDMAKMVPSRTQNPQLLALAAAVEAAQAPEMQQITTLLESFGKPAPSADEHGGHGGHAMPGMMTPEQMTALENATGPEFDRQWMQMMIEHHIGAIDMANTVLAEGVNPDTKALATSIVAAQQAEIDQMKQMLGQS
ncbi:DUF305 domain-containing protein [Nocardia cyriacigeorgica]|uniref:DUF305 domain-containing protein n=1 Tax=Nocardia cyriacigeorgica TaxID=135487 RepID=UPI0018962857|nr:DUF305 domain-containing protein [Nocardia cyriacigeorgica]MBF6097567.1 DUF305 domain-containing protein [Nocardia cyriacigeorgica]MBF6161373.1 DUF305 domain-containing protein [Nocardia cyriacigeorgica]MBF6200202.1 DUF305 domain-containing protein [Nocardia cyriacigeorgica]MBF6318508.1 DUF305 domain-containing protein [Nocardia cyriacigeorgica]MBF6341945.1 DUF305 domain-containing protein [Nocardia cyriacigeorgica]